jgi:hypothetical protein
MSGVESRTVKVALTGSQFHRVNRCDGFSLLNRLDVLCDLVRPGHQNKPALAHRFGILKISRLGCEWVRIFPDYFLEVSGKHRVSASALPPKEISGNQKPRQTAHR